MRAAELRPVTLSAWNSYVRSADAKAKERVHGGAESVWMEQSSERMARIRGGEIVVAPAAGKGITGVPNGLIHDWIGAAFIPNATLEGLLAVVHDYGRYKDFYKPFVADSRVLACTGSEQRFSMTWQHRVLFVRAAMRGEYDARDTFIDARRGYNIAETTEVREIQDYGQAAERMLPPGEGSGYLWRVHSIAVYEERDGGVYLQLRAIALTRSIPASLKWLLSSVVNHLSIDSLTTSLRQTREAVEARSAEPARVAGCGKGVGSARGSVAGGAE